MKYIGTYNNDADIATKAKVDAKQDKVLVDGILQGDGAGTISAAETQEVELVELTKADVGLGNVDNTSDADKPISTATQAALNGKQATITGGASTITSSNLMTNRALVSDADGKVAVSEVTGTELGYLDGVTSNIQTQLDSKLSAAPVTSVNSKTGAVVLSASDVGAQPAITANGFLKGDGSGNITADKPVFTVNMTPTSEGDLDYTADKTVAEIVAAYETGYTVQAVCQVPGVPASMVLPLAAFNKTTFDFIYLAFSVASFMGLGNVNRGWTIVHSDHSENWRIYDLDMVPDYRTINSKPLSSNITLNADDVNAVGLKGNQEIAGTKTFTEKVKFHPSSVSFDNGEVNFNGANIFLDGNRVQFLPTVSTSDNGKFLRVVNGAWAAATVENANGVSF